MCSTSLLYKILPTNLVACKAAFYIFQLYITSEVNSTTRRCFLSYRPWTECSFSQFCKANFTQSIFRTIVERAFFAQQIKNWPHYKTFSSRESYNVGTVQSQQSASMWCADNNGLLANTFKKFSYSPLWLAGSHFFAKFAVRAVNVWMNINRVTL